MGNHLNPIMFRQVFGKWANKKQGSQRQMPKTLSLLAFYSCFRKIF